MITPKLVNIVGRLQNPLPIQFFSIRNFSSTDVDVFIVGGGVSGTALFYTLSKFTNIKRIVLCERRSDYGLVASHAKNNSQTIHCGDIETNYTPETAMRVKRCADMLRNYLTKLPISESERICQMGQKMVLGVGERECQFLSERYKPFKEIFPNLEYLTKEQIGRVEPNIVKGRWKPERPEQLNALYIANEHTTAEFGLLSRSFVQSAMSLNDPNKDITPLLNTNLKRIQPLEDGTYQLITSAGKFKAKFVVFSACGYSLYFAHKLGHGLQYSVLPVAGSFYFAPNVLKGKVYTVQNPVLPFSAIHGDPDILVGDKCRFGPTAVPLPFLERYNYWSLFAFLRVLKLDRSVLSVYMDLFTKPEILKYMIKNFFFEIPIISRILFLRDARKIVPSLRFRDLKYSKGFGGVRPQLIDKTQRKLLFGQTKISSDCGLIFNVTASPGATTCLSNAEIDMRQICQYLNAKMDESAFKRELLEGKYPVNV